VPTLGIVSIRAITRYVWRFTTGLLQCGDSMRWFQNSVKFLAIFPAAYFEVMRLVRAVAPRSATCDLAVVNGYDLFAASRPVRSDDRTERSRGSELAHVCGTRRLANAGYRSGPEKEKSKKSERNSAKSIGGMWL
jgi:hypothetical protein